MVAKVEIAIACGYNQSYQWWGPVMGKLIAEQKTGDVDIIGIYPYGSALPDNVKNKAVAATLSKRRGELTDMNRDAGVAGFLNREADWLMWLDDDTVPPTGFLNHLLSLGREFVGGLYFLGGEPYNPIAYMRDQEGLYHPIYEYAHGALIPVDSIGMGCTLIHRSVYERIMEEHEVWQRAKNGSLLAVPKGEISETEPQHSIGYYRVGDNLISVQEFVPTVEDDNRFWPFYAMEYSRTEDHHFCELAANVGLRPYLDTSVVCNHLKVQAISRSHYLKYKDNVAPEGSSGQQ